MFLGADGRWGRGSRPFLAPKHMLHSRSLFGLLCTVALLYGGCTGSASTERSVEETARFPETYHRVVTPPFAVIGSDGTPISHPFYGGVNTPRPQFVDVDGDGDEDLFVQHRSDRLVFFEHVREGGSSRLVWRSDRYQDLSIGEWFRFVDLDQDGTPDLLAEQPFSHIRVYRNTGTGEDPEFEVFVDTLRTPAGEPIFSDRQNIPNVTDIDCDDQLDLFLGRLDGTITRYEAVDDSAGMPRFAHVTDNFEGIEIVNQQLGLRHGANTLTFADVDGDDDQDLFWGDFFEPGLLFIENTGSCDNPVLSGEPEPFPPSEPLKTSGYNAPTLADWTGNGQLDLFVGVLGGADDANASLAQNFYFYEHTESDYQLRTRQFLGGVDVGSESVVAVGDLDGDDLPDLLLANKIDPNEGETSRVYRFTNTGPPSAPTFRQNGSLDLPSAYHYAPALGDVSGNGRADLVLGTWTGEVTYHRNEGDGTFAAIEDVEVELPGGTHAVPALGDLDDDGRLDLVVGAGDGSLYAYQNTGSATEPAFRSAPELLPELEFGSRSAPALHDVNGNGRLDLLVGTEEGLFLLRNEGTGSTPSFVEDPDSLALDGVAPLATPVGADLESNGQFDLVLGGEGGGLVLFQTARPR